MFYSCGVGTLQILNHTLSDWIVWNVNFTSKKLLPRKPPNSYYPRIFSLGLLVCVIKYFLPNHCLTLFIFSPVWHLLPICGLLPPPSCSSWISQLPGAHCLDKVLASPFHVCPQVPCVRTPMHEPGTQLGQVYGSSVEHVLCQKQVGLKWHFKTLSLVSPKIYYLCFCLAPLLIAEE